MVVRHCCFFSYHRSFPIEQIKAILRITRKTHQHRKVVQPPCHQCQVARIQAIHLLHINCLRVDPVAALTTTRKRSENQQQPNHRPPYTRSSANAARTIAIPIPLGRVYLRTKIGVSKYESTYNTIGRANKAPARRQQRVAHSRIPLHHLPHHDHQRYQNEQGR